MKILMKISGEALKGEENLDNKMLEEVYNDIKLLHENNEVIVVVGGGNFWRGRKALDINSVVSDQAGMLATVMNALVLNNFLNLKGLESNVFGSFEIDGIIKKYNEYDVTKAIRKNKIIVIGGGLGVPNFSTDMTVVQKALELKADMIVMAKNIDGIYDRNPNEEGAIKYDEIDHKTLLLNQIETGMDKQAVMDFEALASLAKNTIPLYLYDAKDKTALEKILRGEIVGTKVVTK